MHGPGLLFSSVVILSQTAGILGRGISPSQGRYLNTEQHKHRINAYTNHTSMPSVGFEPTIPATERAKTVLWPTLLTLQHRKQRYFRKKIHVNLDRILLIPFIFFFFNGMGDQCCSKPPVSGFRNVVYRYPVRSLERNIGMSKDLYLYRIT
jgi:hypothetical protein